MIRRVVRTLLGQGIGNAKVGLVIVGDADSDVERVLGADVLVGAGDGPDRDAPLRQRRALAEVAHDEARQVRDHRHALLEEHGRQTGAREVVSRTLQFKRRQHFSTITLNSNKFN